MVVTRNIQGMDYILSNYGDVREQVLASQSMLETVYRYAEIPDFVRGEPRLSDATVRHNATVFMIENNPYTYASNRSLWYILRAGVTEIDVYKLLIEKLRGSKMLDKSLSFALESKVTRPIIDSKPHIQTLLLTSFTPEYKHGLGVLKGLGQPM